MTHWGSLRRVLQCAAWVLWVRQQPQIQREMAELRRDVDGFQQLFPILRQAAEDGF